MKPEPFNVTIYPAGTRRPWCPTYTTRAVIKHVDGSTVTFKTIGPPTRGRVGIRKWLHDLRKDETNEYYTWNLDDAVKGIEPIVSIDDLRIPGLTVDEADEFWHAVNDNDGYGKVVPSELGVLVDAAEDGDVIEYGGYKCLVVKKIGDRDV